MKFKGTPGEWFAVEYCGTHLIQDGDVFESNDLLSFEDVGEEKARANAKLLAESPQLLKGLKECVTAITGGSLAEDGCYTQRFGPAFVEHLNSIIKKATE